MNEKLRQIRSLLLCQSTLVLATADGDARPRSTPLFYITGDDLRLYWFSSRTSLHSRNCARNPSASVAIFRNTHCWQQIRGVQMDGRVSVVAARTMRRRLTQIYCARFSLGEPFHTTIRRSGLYCFTPGWARYLDNSRQFGFKFELKLADSGAACVL